MNEKYFDRKVDSVQISFLCCQSFDLRGIAIHNKKHRFLLAIVNRSIHTNATFSLTDISPKHVLLARLSLDACVA